MEEEMMQAQQEQSPEEMGRGGDTVMAHLSLGELVIPRAFLDDPDFMQMMQKVFEANGTNINEFIVGDKANKINPQTGYAEFGWFSKLFSFFSPAYDAFTGGKGGGLAAALGILGGSALGGGGSGFGGSILGGGGGAKSASTGGLGSIFSGLTGGGGGGSTFGLRSISSLLGGLQSDSALDKIKKQQLNANQQQLANLEGFDPSQIENQPGYKFNLEQGQKGLNKQLAAGGGLFSGKALKAATEYNQNYANNAFKDYYSQWLNKTGAQNQLYGSGGDINANATLAKSNNLSQTLSNLFNSKVGPYGGYDQEWLKKLFGANYA